MSRLTGANVVAIEDVLRAEKEEMTGRLEASMVAWEESAYVLETANPVAETDEVWPMGYE